MKKNVIVFAIIGVFVGFALGAGMMAILDTGDYRVKREGNIIEKPFQDCEINETGEGYNIVEFKTEIEGFETYDTPESVKGHQFAYITEDESGRTDVYVYDTDTDIHTRITDSDDIETEATLSEDYIFFSTLGGAEYDEISMYVYDRHTSEILLIEHAKPIPKTSGFVEGVFVYALENNNTANRDFVDEPCTIKAYNPVSGTIETLASPNGSITRISADAGRLVWADDRNGNLDIFMYDLNTGEETTICDAKGVQKMPDIAGDLIVWEDHRNDYGISDSQSSVYTGEYKNGDIYGYIISTGREIEIDTTVNRSAFIPQVSVNPIDDTINCVYVLSKSGNAYEYGTYMMATFSSRLTRKPVIKTIVPWMSWKMGPFLSGNWVSWTDFVTSDRENKNNSDTFVYSIYDDEIIHIESSVNGYYYSFIMDDYLLITGVADIVLGAFVSRAE